MQVPMMNFENFDVKGLIETSSVDERETVLNMFSRHYLGIICIHRSQTVMERIGLRTLFTMNASMRIIYGIEPETTSELSAYLYINWYQPGKWQV